MIPRCHVNVFFSDEDGCYVAEVPDLDGLSALGDTPHEAVTEVETAVELWIEVASEHGRVVPEARYERRLSG